MEDNPKTMINANVVIPKPWPSAPHIPTKVPLDADIVMIISHDKPGDNAPIRHSEAKLHHSDGYTIELYGAQPAVFLYSTPDYVSFRVYHIAFYLDLIRS